MNFSVEEKLLYIQLNKRSSDRPDALLKLIKCLSPKRMTDQVHTGPDSASPTNKLFRFFPFQGTDRDYTAKVDIYRNTNATFQQRRGTAEHTVKCLSCTFDWLSLNEL